MAVVTNDVCSTAYSGINDNMICAGGVEGEDSCQVSIMVVVVVVVVVVMAIEMAVVLMTLKCYARETPEVL